MSVDLQPAETFALATLAQRKQILSDRYSSTSEEGVLGQLRLVQTQLFEAKERKDAKAIEALWAEEKALMKKVQEAHWRWNTEPQNFELRHDLLTLDRPEAKENNEERQQALDRIQSKLGISVDHHVQTIPSYAQEEPSAEARKPSVLPESALELEKILKKAVGERGVSGVTQVAWEWLSKSAVLDRHKLQEFLNRLTQPVLANTVELVLRELNESIPTHDSKNPRVIRFGDTGLHRMLTLDQLKQLRAKKPELWENSATFVADSILKDRPFVTIAQWMEQERDGGLSNQVKQQYLDQLWQVAVSLPVHHGALRGAVMFHALWYGLDLTGEVDLEKLQVYAKLPRTNGGNVLTWRSEDSFGWGSGLSSSELTTKRQQIFHPNNISSTFSHPQQGNGIFNQYTPGNEVTLFETAIRQDLKSTLLLMKGSDQAKRWLTYINQDWAVKYAAQQALTTPGALEGLSAHEVDQLKNKLGSSELQQLKSQIKLEFGSLKKNKKTIKQYKAKEKVELDVILKNIPILLVKVFHIHARNFYTKKGVEIDASNLELDGLTPKEELKLEYQAEEKDKWSEFFVYQRTLDFPSLSALPRGIFVIELLASGYRSRAIIRKGGIVALSNCTAQGHVFRLVEEESAEQIDNGSLYLNGQTYHSDPKSGLILVPYSAAPNSNQKIVVMRNTEQATGASASSADATFATLSSFSHLAENYSFSAKFYLDREAVLSKTRAQVLIHPRLEIHGERVNIERNLSKVVLRIDTTDDENVPSTHIVENFAIKNDEDAVHVFTVPDNLKSVAFTLTGEVKKYSNGEKQSVQDSCSFTMNTLESTHFLEDFYLKFGEAADGGKDGVKSSSSAVPASRSVSSTGEWCLYVYGKTGEPIRNRQVQFTLRHEYVNAPLQYQTVPELQLSTDETGCIRLGSLDYVTELTAVPVGTSAITTPQQHVWTLSPGARSTGKWNAAWRKNAWSAGVDETLVIPWDGIASQADLANPEKFLLMEDLGATQLGRNMTKEHVALARTESDSSLQIRNLPAGHYLLLYKLPLASSGGLWSSFTIHIVSGVRVMGEWILDKQSRGFVQTEKQEARKNGRLGIVEVKRQGAEQVVIQLSGVTASTRVHVTSTNFFPEWNIAQRLGNWQVLPAMKVQIYSIANSSYFKQKLLGDEVSYILQRKLEGDRVGNMLPRPSLLLHERVKQDTQFAADPTLSTGEAYTSADVQAAAAVSYGSSGFGARAEFAPQAAYAARPMASKAYAYAQQAQPMVGGYNGESDGSSSVGIVPSWDGGAPQQRHNFEFLSQPSIVLANLKPDENGQVVIDVKQLNATHNALSIFALDNNQGYAYERFGLKPPSRAQIERDADAGESALALDLAFRDTRLMPGLDADKHYSEQHLISILQPGEVLVVDDVKTAVVESYDHAGDYWNLIQILTKNAGQRQELANLQQFAWITGWKLLSEDEKDRKYSEFACHELHIYLAEKDHAFFARVIQPFLRNKLQKTFIDMYLLEHDLASWVQPHALETLNIFEKLLLARGLARGGSLENKQRAVAILDLIIQTSLAQSAGKEDTEAFLAFFKTALQSKSLSKSKDDTGGNGLLGPSGRETREQRATKARDMDKGMAPPPPPPAQAPAPMMAFGGMPAPAPMRSMAAPASSISASAGPGGGGARGGKAKKKMAMSRDRRADKDDHDEDAEEEMAEGGFGGEKEEATFEDFAADLDDGLMQARRLYQAPPTTKEYEERNYWDVSSSEPGLTVSLVQLNKFWADYASHLKQSWIAGSPKAFLTQNLGEYAASFSDILFRLAVIDFPDASTKIEHNITGSREKSLRFEARTPCLVFHKEMKALEKVGAKKKAGEEAKIEVDYDEEEKGEIRSPAASSFASSASNSISVSSNYIDPLDLFQEPSLSGEDERTDKYITEEFLTYKIYGCRVVLTNISSSRQRVSVLLQIPEGSLPVGAWSKKGVQTTTKFVEIGAYSSEVLTYLFYWPNPGRYKHYPPSATKKGVSVGFGAKNVLKVVSKPSAVKKNLLDWRQLSQTGTEEEILAFLQSQNLLRIQLNLICWRFNQSSVEASKAFWQRVTEILRRRLIYDLDIWSFAFKFQSALGLKELLQRSADSLSWQLGSYFLSDTITKDDASPEWNSYQHLEYSPLLNARAHTLRTGGGAQRSASEKKELKIQNVQFSNQYGKFMAYLSERISGVERMTRKQKLAITYYLLLQERYQEAKKMFDSIPAGQPSTSSVLPSDAEDSSCQLQYDYFLCYFAFFTLDPSSALSIAKRYANYPVLKKRKLFAEIETQIMEISGGSNVDPEETKDEFSKDPENALQRDNADREREIGNLAASEPSLDFAFINASTIEIQYENISEIKVNLYKMNVELMFSSSPFMIHDSSSGANDKSTNSILWVTPNDTITLSNLPQSGFGLGKRPPLTVKLPDQYLKTNCWIEVTNSGGVQGRAGQAAAGSGGLSIVKPHFAHQLNVQLTANYGQVRVCHAVTGKPLPQTYIKCYGKPKDGSAPVFYKDGYTDLRGKFDYASLSTDKLSTTSKFSILILHPDFGAVVKSAEPPQQ